MLTTINNSLDWEDVRVELEKPIYKMKKYRKELFLISKNIGLMVKELSNEEINCRRLQTQTSKHIKLLNEINVEIQNFEQLVTIGLLINS